MLQEEPIALLSLKLARSGSPPIEETSQSSVIPQKKETTATGHTKLVRLDRSKTQTIANSLITSLARELPGRISITRLRRISYFQKLAAQMEEPMLLRKEKNRATAAT